MLGGDDSCDMAGEGGEKPLSGKIGGGFGVQARSGFRLLGEDEGCFVEEVFQSQLPQQNLVSLRVGTVFELGEDRKVWFRDSDRVLRSLAVFEQHQPSQPRLRRLITKCSLAVCDERVI